MFTIAQIQQAHSKVKSGADFPAYIKEIKALGVTYYKTFVADGHTEYHGTADYKTATDTKYNIVPIADHCNLEQFKTDLKAHQQGQSDYLTFIAVSAACGIEKWAVDMEKMTCTYYDKAGNEVLVEQIPQ
ncbi:DUF1398 domain-containing protein [Flavobacterium sp. WW92]|uniref:DUF1398 domain-containing protein n=1 Tax=unclassified Flavobacterium TaxID=196869 RepID=UPI0022254FC3|nr:MULTISPECIES: DUF1398 domain-containing protein [unclassified Flavobacterium]WDO14553.1 DUF1398 domain-containing protein [Flavobacterium sp. WW92]